MIFGYRLLIFTLSPILLLYFAWFSLRNKQLRYFWQRTGFNLNHLPKHALWFHCASVGEVITALPLITEILHDQSSLQIIVTTNTVTGAKIVQQQARSNLKHAYLPFDWAFAVNRFIRKLKPQALFVVETEIWPNLFYYCHKNHCPVSIINARLSIKTMSANVWIKALLKSTLCYTDNIYTRSELDQTAYLALGADENKLHVIGNLKYGKKAEASHHATLKIDRDYVLVASTHNDEELQIARHWLNLDRNELLFIAPRHPERCPTIMRQLKQLSPDLTIAVHSQHDVIDNHTSIYILDTVGELINYFAAAKLVIMGGSFVPIGGHNILEPAQFGCAIICGPYMNNFKDEVNLLLEKNALLQLTSLNQLETTLEGLLAKNNRLRQLGSNSQPISQDFNRIVVTYAHIIENVVSSSITAASLNNID